MLMGYWIHNGIILLKNKTCQIVLILSLVVMPVMGVLTTYGIFDCEAWIGNSSPIIVLYSISIFSLAHNQMMKDTKNNVVKGIVTLLSRHSFPIYLIHMLWLNVLYKIIGLNPFLFTPFIGFCITFLLTMLLSYLSSAIVKRIPIIKRLF